MKKLLALYVVLNFSGALLGQWGVLIYMEARYQMADVACKTVTDLMQGMKDAGTQSIYADVYIELHVQGMTAYRYKAHAGDLTFVENVTLSHDHRQNLVRAAEWAFGSRTYEHTMLILWNHGQGVLNYLGSSVEHGSIYEDDELSATYTQRAVQSDEHGNHKGLMLANTVSLMTTQELVYACKEICDALDVRLDILGFDMCGMAMFEIATLLQPYVRYMVGSQDCELRDGWDFKAIGSLTQSESDPEALALALVQSYDEYYGTQRKEGTYTQSVMCLAQIPELKANNDRIARLLCEVPELMLDIHIMRLNMSRMCLCPQYTDLYECYAVLSMYVTSREDASLEPLIAALEEGMKLVKNVVVDNKVGLQRRSMHGLSIYFPLSRVDPSYYDITLCGQWSWIDFLEICVNA